MWYHWDKANADTRPGFILNFSRKRREGIDWCQNVTIFIIACQSYRLIHWEDITPYQTNPLSRCFDNLFTYVTTFDKVTSLPLGTFTFLLTSWTVWSLGTHQILVGCDGNIEQAVNHWDINSKSVTGKVAAEIASAVISHFLAAHYKNEIGFLFRSISHEFSQYQSYHTMRSTYTCPTLQKLHSNNSIHCKIKNH